MGLPAPSSSRFLLRGSIRSNPLEFFREHYKIPESARISLEFANIPNPGYVVVLPSLQFSIVLNSAYQGWHDAETAVLSHEMAHVVMKCRGFTSGDRDLEEIYTDSFAVFLGSGLLANFSESVEYYASGSLSMRLGYLDRQSRLYAMALFLVESGLPVPGQPSGPWRASDLQGLSRAHSLLLARRLSRNRLSNKKSPECPSCQVELGVIGRVASCPLCLSQWIRGFWGWKPSVPDRPIT